MGAERAFPREDKRKGFAPPPCAVTLAKCRRYRGTLSCAVRASGGEAQSRWSDTGVVLSLVSEGGLKLRIFYFSPSHWWSIGTRMVWHLLRVSPGAPTNLACEGRVACLNGLVRGACQPRFVEAALGTHTHPAAFVAGARHVPVGWTALVECVSPTKAGLRDSAGGTRLERRLPRRHGWHPWRGARLRKDQDRSTGKLLADTRARSSLRRARCGRTPTQVICHGVRSRFSTRASARNHSSNELSSPMSAS